MWDKIYKKKEAVVSREIAEETILVPVRGQLADMQKSLDVLTTERDEAKQAAEQAALEKKNNDLSSHFTKSVIDSFGAENAEMAVGFGMAKGLIKYTESGEMGYKDKVGNEAIEAFRVDNARLIQNKGTNTSGGNNSAESNNYISELEAQMLRD